MCCIMSHNTVVGVRCGYERLPCYCLVFIKWVIVGACRGTSSWAAKKKCIQNILFLMGCCMYRRSTFFFMKSKLLIMQIKIIDDVCIYSIYRTYVRTYVHIHEYMCVCECMYSHIIWSRAVVLGVENDLLIRSWFSSWTLGVYQTRYRVSRSQKTPSGGGDQSCV